MLESKGLFAPLHFWTRPILTIVLGLLLLQSGLTLPVTEVVAQDVPAVEANVGPLGQFITVGSTIDAKKYAKLSRIAKLLDEKAKSEKRKAVLVLEFSDGPSRFGDVRELAKFLTEQLREVRTVTWMPKDVRGMNVIAVLACNDIVMAPKAGLGDMGRGKPVDRDVQTYVETLVARRHNPMLSNAVIRAMMNPAEEVVLVRKKVGAGANAVSETELVTPAQLQKMIDDRVIIDEHKVVKAAGSAGLFQGATARNGNFLASQVADARADIAKVYGLPRESMRDDPSAGSELVARRIKIEGEITRMSEEFLNRQIKRMQGEGANLIIFEIDSPGGRLDVAMTLAGNIAELDPKKVRTVAYIPQKATSSAAVVALGCDDIVMHPDAVLGNIALNAIAPMGPPPPPPQRRPQRGQVQPPPPPMPVAQVQDLLSTFANVMKPLAERKQRPSALVLAMADKDLKVYEATNKETGEVSFLSDDDIQSANGDWIKGGKVPETGTPELLQVDGTRAHQLRLAEEPVASFDDLKERYAVPVTESLPPVGPTWVDSLVFLLNDGRVTGVLFVIGIICIYAEMHVPSGLFMIVACVCFGLFFWSRFLGGTADWLEVMLFLLGIGCIALEIFVVPGFGVFGVSGALMVLAALVLASQTFFIPTSSSDYRELADHLSTLGGSLVGCVVIAFALSRFLPRMPLLNRMVLVPPGGSIPSTSGVPLLRPELATDQDSHFILNPNASLVGVTGSTVSVLRPSGKAQFGDRLVDVVSEGPYIDPGTAIQVIEVNGNRVVVREIV